MRTSRRAVLVSTAGAIATLSQRAAASLAMELSRAVLEWVRRAAIPLSTPVAGHGFDDMASLKKMVGDARIVALGEATHGTREFSQPFRARSTNGTMQTFTVGPLPAGSLDATLAASGIPLFALDLRTAPKTGPVAEWLRASHPTRNIMGSFSEDRPNWTIFDQVVTERYDGLLFVDKTTAAHANAKSD
jgi:erythromycin esterase-like protein